MSLLTLVLVLAGAAFSLPPRILSPDAVGADDDRLRGGSERAEALRVEYFVIEGPRDDAKGASGLYRPEALIAWRRLEGERGVLLERDVLFRDGFVRILHDETVVVDEGEPRERLVFRELRGALAPGRCWLVDVEPDGRAIRTLAWGSRGHVHGRLATENRPLAPLALIERLRGGDRLSEATVIDPLTRSVECRTLHRLDGDPYGLAFVTGGAQARLRTAELLRADGTVAGRYVFRGEELMAFQWRDGARRARRIEALEYEQLLLEWTPAESAAPVDAAVASNESR
ncbi:MAG: hypothetical protein GY711_24715 [bacterium]|nr:hypothetical protein [bacterium]